MRRASNIPKLMSRRSMTTYANFTLACSAGVPFKVDHDCATYASDRGCLRCRNLCRNRPLLHLYRMGLSPTLRCDSCNELTHRDHIKGYRSEETFQPIHECLHCNRRRFAAAIN